jgi:hypothetical protein
VAVEAVQAVAELLLAVAVAAVLSLVLALLAKLLTR